MTSSLESSLAAETRAVEEGHRAFVQDDGSIRVVSDTRPGVAYHITFDTLGGDQRIRFWCDCPASPHHSRTQPGHVVCKHEALAARRLEREGLARWDPEAGWVITDKAAITRRPDPFERL